VIVIEAANTTENEEYCMDKQKLIDKLNEDLSNELAAIIQYITYSAQVTGPFRLVCASLHGE
jgi:bacterioferritin (cytochrome b1)